LIAFKINGRIKNARNGRSITGVRVVIEENGVAVTEVNSYWGFFTLRNVPAGTVTIKYVKNGYITNEKSMQITGDVNSGGVADINMSPSMATDEWRSVLKWGRGPSDLDSYAKWGWSKVCWYGTRQRSNGLTGTLEQDRTSGYGPETVYLAGVGNCRGGSYYCDIKGLINDYTESGSMLREGQAEVTLYTGTRVAGVFKITDCPHTVSSDGNWWHVYTIDGATNQIKWACNTASLLQTNGTSVASPVISTAGVKHPRLRIRSIAQ